MKNVIQAIIWALLGGAMLIYSTANHDPMGGIIALVGFHISHSYYIDHKFEELSK